jgi:Putative peptidoglycan binding domain
MKLLISMALLAAGFAVASCEKTPSGESGADAQNQSGSTTSARQSDGAAQAQQQAQEPPDKSPDQAARAANEQQSKQVQHEQPAQDRNTGDKQNQSSSSPSQEQRDQSSVKAPDQNHKAKEVEAQQSEPTQQDRANVQSPSSAQSDRAALQQGQAQTIQPQQNQAQQNEPEQNQPQQAGVGAAGGAVHLGPEQIRQAQMVLKQKGFDVGLADGIMGPRTRKAVTAFQQQQGLQATGQIDQRTVTALGMVTGSGPQDNQGSGSTTGHGGTGAQ